MMSECPPLVTLPGDLDAQIDAGTMEPLQVLPNFRSPCWYEPLPDLDPYPVDSHPYTRYFSWNTYLHNIYSRGLRKNTRIFNERCKQRQGKWRIRCLPFFYMIGVFKTGSTSLWTSLIKNEPLIEGPPFKEPQYWNNIRNGGTAEYFIWSRYQHLISDIPTPRPLKAYVDLFDGAAERTRLVTTNTTDGGLYHSIIIGEASTTYLTELDYWEKLPENRGLKEPRYLVAHMIKRLTPDVKIIALLRNPVDRLYSQYLFFEENQTKSPQLFDDLVRKAMDLMNNCLATRTLRSCVYDNQISLETPPIAIRHSLYAPMVSDWLKVFGDNFLVLKSEDFYEDSKVVLNQVLEFLGLEKRDEIRISSEFKTPNSVGPMLNTTREILTGYYKEYNHQLSQLLNDDRFLWDI